MLAFSSSEISFGGSPFGALSGPAGVAARTARSVGSEAGQTPATLGLGHGRQLEALVTDLIEPGRTHVQVSLGVRGLCDYYGFPCTDKTPAAWFDDVAIDGNIAFTAALGSITSTDTGYSAMDPADVAVTNTDNDTAGVTITESGGTTDVTEGGAPDSYTVVLDSPPTANVDVTITPDSQTDLGAGAPCIDTPEDLARARDYLQQHQSGTAQP